MMTNGKYHDIDVLYRGRAEGETGRYLFGARLELMQLESKSERAFFFLKKVMKDIKSKWAFEQTRMK